MSTSINKMLPVIVVPEYPASLMTGGVQVQAAETLHALQRAGQNAIPFGWSDDAPSKACYHFVGFPPYMTGLANLVRQAALPYVCTVLMGGAKDDQRGRILVAALRHRLAAFTSFGNAYRRALMGASAVITITHGDSIAARKVFGIPAHRLHVIPNGVSRQYIEASPERWTSTYGPAPFLLCVGAIQSRKSQLLLAQACNRTGIPLVLIGPVLQGEEDYGSAVGIAMEKNLKIGGRWIKGLSPDDPVLYSAFAACRAFVLLSRRETQPLSVLQAMASKKPVLLAKASYAKEEPFNELLQVPLGHEPTIDRALNQIWTTEKGSALPPSFCWDNVAGQLMRLYARCV